MDERDHLTMRADCRSMSTAALQELLRRDAREDLLDASSARAIAEIIRERREREDPENCPAVDLAWKSFRENVLSFRAQFRRFLRRTLPKLLILSAVLAGIALLLFLGTRPVISEPILDTVVRSDGGFAMRDIAPGMTRDALTAYLKERGLRYTQGDASDYSYPGMYLRPDPREDLRDVTWISLTGETRIAELGGTTVRRDWFFRGDRLEFAALVTDPAAGDISDDMERGSVLLQTLTDAFGPPDEGDPALVGTRGEHGAAWNGADGSRLELIGRYHAESVPAAAGGIDKEETETYQIVIRITPRRTETGSAS